MKNRNYRKIYRSGSTIKAQTIEGCSPMTIAVAVDEDAARDIIDALETRQRTKDLNDYNTPADAFEPCENSECYDNSPCDLSCEAAINAMSEQDCKTCSERTGMVCGGGCEDFED